jgi:hypothetical protein
MRFPPPDGRANERGEIRRMGGPREEHRMGPRPVSNFVIIVLLTAVLAFGAYVTFDMARSAVEGPSPPATAAHGA